MNPPKSARRSTMSRMMPFRRGFAARPPSSDGPIRTPPFITQARELSPLGCQPRPSPRGGLPLTPAGSNRPEHGEPARIGTFGQRRFAFVPHIERLDAGSARSLSAGLEHGVDRLQRPREHRLDRPIATVARPTLKSVQLGLMLCPSAKADALDTAADDSANDAAPAHGSSTHGLASRPGADQRGWMAANGKGSAAGQVPGALGSNISISRT